MMGKTGQAAGADSSFGPLLPWVVILIFFGMGLGGALGPRSSSATSLVTAIVSAPGLNVRAGPGRGHPVLSTLSQGDAVQLLGEEQAENGSTWVRVRAAGQDGWVSLKYLSAAAGGSPQVTSGPPRTSPRPRVTLQYQRQTDLRTVSSLRAVLDAREGWHVSGPERVLPAGDNRPETYAGVRYFFEADSALARAVCTEVVVELARRG
ncbi:MAG TPA: SH3 domain-containing protein, partial [Longimicrobium sp.]